MEAQAKQAPPCTLVIFGAAGDLTKRLLVPALYNLRRTKLLPENFALIGISRDDKSDDGFRSDFATALNEFAPGNTESDDWKWLAARMRYLRGDFDDPAAYKTLEEMLADADKTHQTAGNYLFYLATPPNAFAVIVKQLGDAGLIHEAEGHWRRVIVEKPFGHDLASAEKLNRQLLDVLDESQIYRIDHYLGKETVQNILVLRFANGLFEPLWNRNHIDHVQITVGETIGVEHRGKFYDATGALRDMVPNHLFQLLTLVAMEPPSCLTAEALRSEKAKVLDAVRPFRPEDVRANVVRGQYRAGLVVGKDIASYRQSPDVPSNSNTETYVALKLMIGNWRWAGVPFYLRTGKALAARKTEIVVRFKQAPLALFRATPVEQLTSNDLVLHIQPDEGVTLRFSAKIPGPSVNIGGVEMRFDYEDYFKATARTGYETLIYDSMTGDPTLFQRADNIEAGWRVVQPIIDAWGEEGAAESPNYYAAGSTGPAQALDLLSRDNRHWRPITASERGALS